MLRHLKKKVKSVVGRLRKEYVRQLEQQAENMLF